MNRMNVNFFICENSFIICSVWGLFSGFCFFFFSLHLLGERAMADMGVGCREALSEWLGGHARLSLSRPFCVSHSFFFFQNWDPSC